MTRYVHKTLGMIAWGASSTDNRFARVGLGLMLVGLAIRVVSAGIPEMSAILHGPLFIDGQEVTSDDNVSVLARIDGVALPIGTYVMGANSAAGNNYVLKLRVESPFDGVAQSDDAGIVGQTANLLVRVGDGPERPVGQFAISASGIIEQRILSVETTFGSCADEDGDIGLDDAAVFIDCLLGVGSDAGLGCGCADANGDADADLADWAAFQNSFTGAL